MTSRLFWRASRATTSFASSRVCTLCEPTFIGLFWCSGVLTPAGSNYGSGDITHYDEWAAALELAVLWGFERVREFIVKRVKETGTLAEQIVTARRLDMQDWCWDVCAEICQRREPLTMEEARRLGLEDTVRISQVREKRRAHPTAILANGRRHEFEGFDDDWREPMALSGPPSGPLIDTIKKALHLPNASIASPPIRKRPSAFDNFY